MVDQSDLSVHGAQPQGGGRAGRKSLIKWAGIITALLTLVSMATTTVFLVPHQARADAAPAATASGGTVPLGAQFGFEFVDLVKQGARFQAIGSAPALTYDANGWPQSDFEFIFLDARRNMPWDGPDFNGVHRNFSGVYHLAFTGQAKLVSLEDPNALVFQNVVYNASTNVTTAAVVLQPNHWLAAIGFTNTKRNPTDAPGNGITNVRLIRPGYALSTTQVFTNDFLNTLKQLHPSDLRSFDNGMNSYNIWNGTNLVDVKWSDRSLPTDAYWPLDSRNSGDKRGLAVPWEYYIMVANAVNSDLWINIPVGADDDYITQLATLLKNGDQFTPGLKPGLHVYVEYSNEVWNWGFSQSIYNQVIAQQEGISNEQRYVERTIQISNLFSAVYGAAAINRTIRPVALWQYNTELDMQSALSWAQSKFGNPPNHYLYGIGEAPYLDPLEHSSLPYTDPSDPNAVNRLFDTFYTAAGQRRKVFEEWQAVATNFGLHEVGYESGPSLNAGIEADLTRSPRMADLIYQYYINNYFATGADAVNFFSVGAGVPSRWGDWYSFEDYATKDLYGKWLGALSVSGQPRPAITVGNVLPWTNGASVTIDASQYVVGDANFSKPGSQAGTCTGGCWPFPGSLDYLLRAPTAGTYAITLTGHSDNAAAQLQVQVDNNTVATVSLPQGTDGPVSVGSVTLTTGLHTLVITGAGTGKSTFAPNGGITLQLTKGAGLAIVPSAPLNVTSSVNDSQATLTWENVTTATSYTIQRGTSSGGPYTTVGTSNTNSFTDTGLTNGTTYYYVVQANNVAGASAASPQVVATPTPPAAPAAPTGVTGAAGASDQTPFDSGGMVRITWPAVPNATSYHVKQYDSGSGKFNTIATISGTVFYQNGFTIGTAYKFAVSAVNSFGESPDSTEVDLTPTETAPNAPTNLTATATGNGSISLHWTQAQWQYPSFAFLFHVKRGPSASGPFTPVLDISTNNVVDVGLTPGTQYCYVVTGYNSVGESPNSNAVCATA